VKTPLIQMWCVYLSALVRFLGICKLLIEALKRQAVGSGLKWKLWRWGAIMADRCYPTGNTISIGSIGPLESLPFVLPTLKIQRRAKQYLHQHPPDLVVLIDYAGPNLSIGSYIKRQMPQVPVVYYIARRCGFGGPMRAISRGL